MDISQLPALNAALNSTSAVLLTAGYLFIRKDKTKQHIACMSAACITSVLFLVSYLFYHYHHGSTKFTGEGFIRTLYFSVLISHTILAMVIVPLVFMTVLRAIKGKYEKHKKIARYTLPIWLYVSVTGVIIYWMLYQL